MPDFREQRKQRQQHQQTLQQGIAPVTPEDVYSVPLANRETVSPDTSKTVPQSLDEQLVKTSIYPTQGQLDKLDDLAGEYNKRYRRQRKKIDRQDIIRYLIDQCDLETLTDLQI